MAVDTTPYERYLQIMREKQATEQAQNPLTAFSGGALAGFKGSVDTAQKSTYEGLANDRKAHKEFLAKLITDNTPWVVNPAETDPAKKYTALPVDQLGVLADSIYKNKTIPPNIQFLPKGMMPQEIMTYDKGTGAIKGSGMSVLADKPPIYGEGYNPNAYNPWTGTGTQASIIDKIRDNAGTATKDFMAGFKGKYGYDIEQLPHDAQSAMYSLTNDLKTLEEYRAFNMQPPDLEERKKNINTNYLILKMAQDAKGNTNVYNAPFIPLMKKFDLTPKQQATPAPSPASMPAPAKPPVIPPVQPSMPSAGKGHYVGEVITVGNTKYKVTALNPQDPENPAIELYTGK
jgi:hypothetical protein